MLKDLEEAGMIARKRQTMYRPWWIYVHPLQQSSQKETSGHFQTTSPEETKGSVLMCQRETTETPEGNNMMCQMETTEVPNGNNMSSQEEMTGDFRMASHDTPKGNNMSSQKEIACSFQMASHDTPNGNTNKNNINYTEYIKTEESENDFSKNRKAEAEEAPARAKDSPVKASAYQEHQYKLEMTYAQKGAEAEATTRTARQDWWPENFLELSLDQRAELWRQQTRKQQKE